MQSTQSLNKLLELDESYMKPVDIEDGLLQFGKKSHVAYIWM